MRGRPICNKPEALARAARALRAIGEAQAELGAALLDLVGDAGEEGPPPPKMEAPRKSTRDMLRGVKVQPDEVAKMRAKLRGPSPAGPGGDPGGPEERMSMDGQDQYLPRNEGPPVGINCEAGCKVFSDGWQHHSSCLRGLRIVSDGDKGMDIPIARPKRPPPILRVEQGIPPALLERLLPGASYDDLQDIEQHILKEDKDPAQGGKYAWAYGWLMLNKKPVGRFWVGGKHQWQARWWPDPERARNLMLYLMKVRPQDFEALRGDDEDGLRELEGMTAGGPSNA